MFDSWTGLNLKKLKSVYLMQIYRIHILCALQGEFAGNAGLFWKTIILKGILCPLSILLFSFGELLRILLELSEELQGHFMAEEIYFWLGVGFSLVFREHVHITNCRKYDGDGLKHINYFLECREKKNKNQWGLPKDAKYLTQTCLAS